MTSGAPFQPDFKKLAFSRPLFLAKSTEKMLGHVLGGVMAVYNKHDWLDEQTVAYQLWTERLKLAVSSDSKIAILERKQGA